MKLWKKLMTGLLMAVMTMAMCMGTVMAEDESETQLQETTDTYNILLIGVDRRDDSLISK